MYFAAFNDDQCEKPGNKRKINSAPIQKIYIIPQITLYFLCHALPFRVYVPLFPSIKAVYVGVWWWRCWRQLSWFNVVVRYRGGGFRSECEFHNLTNNKLIVLHNLILWNLQVQRRRTSPNPPGNIVVRTMARTEPSTVVTGLTNRHTAQVCADSQHDEPLWLLDTVGVLLRITERLNLDGIRFFDFGGGTVADEDGLTTPFDDDILALGDGGEVNLDLGHSEDVGGGGHVEEKVCGRGGLMLALHAMYVASCDKLCLEIKSLPSSGNLISLLNPQPSLLMPLNFQEAFLPQKRYVAKHYPP